LDWFTIPSIQVATSSHLILFPIPAAYDWHKTPFVPATITSIILRAIGASTIPQFLALFNRDLFPSLALSASARVAILPYKRSLRKTKNSI
jgi:hypothetical protein